MELKEKTFYYLFFVGLVASVLCQDYERRRPKHRPRPGPRPRDCRWGSVGVCGGFANAQCPPGTTCNRRVWPTQTAGLCCRNSPTMPQSVCEQPKVVGPCRGAIPRWFFNSQTQTCERFIFGGCRGNENNFETRADCQRRCGGVKPPTHVCGGHRPGGTCGGFVGAQCRPGYTCIYTQGTLGTCCPVENVSGTCPPSSGRPGICVFDPRLNCLNDESCGNGRLCCQEGCGRVCKNPVYPNPIPVPY